MSKLLWVDMEMTGLEVEKEVVIEVAAIVTDYEFNEIETYHSIVKQPQAYIDGMDEWNTEHHGESGLTAQIPNGRDPQLVEDDLLQLIARHFPDPKDRPVLAGNSIGQDRLFINRYFPRLAAKLHYRMLDVTAWKIIMNGRFGLKHEKKNSHRAVDDIRESIGEMKFYMSYVKV
jgi:oligoribonuclease